MVSLFFFDKQNGACFSSPTRAAAPSLHQTILESSLKKPDWGNNVYFEMASCFEFGKDKVPFDNILLYLFLVTCRFIGHQMLMQRERNEGDYE